MLRAGLARLGAVDEAEVDRLYPRLLELYGLGLAVHTRLYDGVGAALDRLEAGGWALGICTNKPEGLARGADRGAGARRAVRGAARGRQPALAQAGSAARARDDRAAGGVPERAVLVGDTVTDRDAARAAGVPCVLVGFGPEGDAVAGLGPAAVVGHYEELPEVLERLVPG